MFYHQSGFRSQWDFVSTAFGWSHNPLTPPSYCLSELSAIGLQLDFVRCIPWRLIIVVVAISRHRALGLE